MPDVVKNAYIKAIKNDKTSYSHNKGLFETREASQYFKRKYNFLYSEEEIIVTNGASEALDTSLKTLLSLAMIYLFRTDIRWLYPIS